MTTEQSASGSTDEQKAEALWEAVLSGMTIKDIHGVSDNVMESIYAHAYEFYQAGRVDDAEVFFRFLCLYDTKNPEYQMGLGATLQKKKQYQEAINAYSIMYILAQNDFRPLLHIGQCYLYLKNTEQARESFMLIMESSAPDAMKSQAQAYLLMMKPAEIIETIEDTENTEKTHA